MDKQYKRFTLLKERKILERLDVYPFILIHSIAMICYTQMTLNPIVQMIIFGFIFLLQGITFFSKFWSENLRTKICYTIITDMSKASHVRVDVVSEKFKMNNRTSICELIRKSHNSLNIILIEFEKILLVYDEKASNAENATVFLKPTLNLSNHKLVDFLSFEPLNKDTIDSTGWKFGQNRMNIPIPSFFALYKEHMVAPFFVFQLFCILLWVFDDYGIHSFITLVMLCIFEATIVGQRIFNLATLRKMRVSPHYIFVFRDNAWVKKPSSELMPGDIVSVVEGSKYDSIKEEEEEDTKGNYILQLLKKLKEVKKKAEERANQKSVNAVINTHKEKDISPLTCDMVLLTGSAIVNESMLTGESVPQIKDSVVKLDYEHDNVFDSKLRHKNCILFSGTKVVKVSKEDDGSELPKNVSYAPPDSGCIAVVIRTGFSTSQGKILRSMLYSDERNKGDTKEAFIFIAVLLIIAIWASYYVLIEGLKREGELTYKLLLRCIIILTSVVPAELPIELSLAINNSLFFLQGKRIVCIEPFRIPFAGKIDICCFDKTGTLTKDEFIMKGIVKPGLTEPIKTGEVDEQCLSVILGCNSLLSIKGKVLGDPIELAMFKDADGKFDGNDAVTCYRKTKVLFTRKFQFDSNLKRMTVLSRVYSAIYENESYTRVLCKGAPEVMKNILAEVPQSYDECFLHWARQGYRILALAYKDNKDYTYATKRDELEKDLIFCGFVIVETPLKAKVAFYIKELIKAKYDVCIITGDHLLTTTKVSLDLQLGPSKNAVAKIENNTIAWYDLNNEKICETIDIGSIIALSKKYTLGFTGKEMEEIDQLDTIKDKHLLYQYIKLFCRVSPAQKDDIIKDLIKSGRHPSMCGDGSNDVGALKRAVIGIALLNVEETKQQKQQPFSILSFDDDTTIKSGDVTAAAPFTSKSGSIKCIKNIFIQGRCTLVVTFQMYKILALNCLISAYSLSVLALKGVKFSDYQSTYMGFSVAIFFLMLSKATPLKNLNENKPPHTIFTYASVISIIGQAIVNLTSMFLIIHYTEIMDPVSIGLSKSFDDPFTPTLMNTIMFIYSMINQTITFVVNYEGEPFMENLSKNSSLKKLLVAIVVISLAVIFDIYPQLNEYLELLPLPEDLYYKLSLVGIMSINFLLCYFLENWKRIFHLYK